MLGFTKPTLWFHVTPTVTSSYVPHNHFCCWWGPPASCLQPGPKGFEGCRLELQPLSLSLLLNRGCRHRHCQLPLPNWSWDAAVLCFLPAWRASLSLTQMLHVADFKGVRQSLCDERELTATDNAPTDMATAFNVNTEAVWSSLMQCEMFMRAKNYDVLYYAAVFQNMWRRITTTPNKCHNPINRTLCHWFIIETAVVWIWIQFEWLCESQLGFVTAHFQFSACSIHYNDSYLVSPQVGSDQCSFWAETLISLLVFPCDSPHIVVGHSWTGFISENR